MKSLGIDTVMSWEYGLIIILIGLSLIIVGVIQGKKQNKAKYSYECAKN